MFNKLQTFLALDLNVELEILGCATVPAGLSEFGFVLSVNRAAEEIFTHPPSTALLF